MSITLESLGSERALADWGIEASSAQLVQRSFRADQFSFALASPDALAAAPFAYAQKVTLRQDGTVIFIGTIRDLPLFGSASAERRRFTAYNYWHALEAWIMREPRHIIDGAFATMTVVNTGEIILGRNPLDGSKNDSHGQIIQLANHANLAVTLDFTGITTVFDQSTDIPIAVAIRRMCAWQPELLGHTDYSSGDVRLVITDRAHATGRTIDLTAGAPLISIEGGLRNDLVPAGVFIDFVTSEVDPASGIRYARISQSSAAVSGASADAPYTISMTIQIGVGDTPPTGLAASYYASLQTPFIEGAFVIGNREADLSWRPGLLLTLTHAPALWAGGVASVIEVTHQLMTGISSVKFGPPQFLSTPSFAGLNALPKAPQSPPPVPAPGAGGGVGSPNGGTHDNGTVAHGGTGGAQQSQPISYCDGGSQKTALVLIA